jgi:hypothetical protein
MRAASTTPRWDCRIVIAFLVVTSIINLALGYALAVYLGAGSSSSAGEEGGDVHPAAGAAGNGFSFDPSRSSWTQGFPATLTSGAGQPPQTPVNLGPISSFPEHQPAGRPDAEPQPIGMEKELLAGIEEFRAQLAQLKSQSLDDTAGSYAGGLSR